MAEVVVGLPAYLGAETVDYYDRGWFRDNGFSPGLGNALDWQTLVGMDPGPDYHRSFFVFDLTGLTGEVVGATLELQLAEYPNGWIWAPFSGTRDYTIYGVGHDPADLMAGYSAGDPTGQAIFDDLGTGAALGNGTAEWGAHAVAGGVMYINLTPDGIADINAHLGEFYAVGVVLDALDTEKSLQFSLGQEQRHHLLELDVIPEPSALALLSAASLVLAAVGWRRARR